MIEIIKASDRYHFETDWLSTYWHFSFDHYYDPNNVSFGHLRVFNHDFVKPGTGFPPHSHRDMEIITYVLSGELEHQDSQGNRGIIAPGEVQVMSAGTGITHAERNPSTTDMLELLQIWVLPEKTGLPPRWAERAFSASDRLNTLFPVASGTGLGDSLKIHQSATISVCRLEQGRTVTHKPEGSRAYLFVIDGRVEANRNDLNRWDSARFSNEPEIAFRAPITSELILLDLP